MTTHSAVLATPIGLTLTAKLFTGAAPDTVYKTAGSVTYRTNATAQAVAEFTDVAAGDYTMIYFSGTRPVAIGYRTFAGTDGETATETPPTVELDSGARVKLDASQPDYAPATAAALATNYALLQLTDTDVAAIEARLPSDPADQSAVEAAITAATSPLATSSALSTAAANIVTILGKFTGITLLARWLGILGGKTADSTTLTEFNATTGGTSYNNTTDSLEAIRDRGDAAWITGTGGSSTAPAQVISPVHPGGKLVLKGGDDYADDIQTTINLPVEDASEAVYDRLTDASTSSIKFAAGRNRVADLIVGTVTKANVTKADGITTVPIQIARSQLGATKIYNDYKYDIQVTTSGGKVTTPVGGELEVVLDNAS